jgi:hypothetical protein
MAGQVGPKAQPNLCRSPGELHHQETGEPMLRRLLGGKNTAVPIRWDLNRRRLARRGLGRTAHDRGGGGDGRLRVKWPHLAWGPLGPARCCHVFHRAGLAAQL